MLLILIILLFCSLQARYCLCSTVCGSISKGVSFTLPIACRLLFNRFAVILLKFRECVQEACYRYFAGPHKYFNGKACCGLQAQCICMHIVRICIYHSVSSALVMHDIYIVLITNNLLLN